MRPPTLSVTLTNYGNLFREPGDWHRVLDLARMAEALAICESGGADAVHVDVMDGHFVPNLTVGPPMVEALRKVTTLPLDVHLMMTNPDEFIPEFAKAGANILTVHVETCPHLHRTVQSIKEHGMKAGVSLNPATSATTLEHILGDVDLVLVMSVNPGFGGQTFIDSTLDKIRQIRTMVSASKGSPYLEVDGGITVKNVASVLKAGANVLVAGSAIFGSDNMSDTIRQLRTADQTVTV